MKTPKLFNKLTELAWRIHIRISTVAAKILGPVVFNFGVEDKGWNITTADLLKFPEGTVGRVLGEFLHKDKLEPLAYAEYHDVHHILFDYSTSLKDEIALQFFLRGNGKTSIASISTSIGAWCLLPFQWNYLRSSYERGKKCSDVSKLQLRTLLYEDINQVKSSLFKA
jgi:ubiquinone biosynthesis protein Coq4